MAGLNRQMDAHKEVSDTALTCVIYDQVILMTFKIWGKCTVAKLLAQFDCLEKSLNEQMIKGVFKEKLFCVQFFTVHQLSCVISDLL